MAAAERPPNLDPSLSQFMQTCNRNYHLETIPAFAIPEPGETVLVPTAALVANQARFSWNEVRLKLKKILQNKSCAYIDKKTCEWVRNHDDGKSVFPENRAITGIYHDGRVYIVDGHHRALISTYLGSQTIPVRIIAKLSKSKSPEEVRQYMADHELSHFKNYLGRPIQPVDLCAMIDDPNLGLARRLIARVDIELKGGKLLYGNIRGSEYVIGAKIDYDLPFLEFEIADTLRRAGIVWSNARSTEFSKTELATFLDILEQAVEADPESRLSQVLLFDRPSRVADLDLQPELTEHLHVLGCEELLKGRKQ